MTVSRQQDSRGRSVCTESGISRAKASKDISGSQAKPQSAARRVWGTMRGPISQPGGLGCLGLRVRSDESKDRGRVCAAELARSSKCAQLSA